MPEDAVSPYLAAIEQELRDVLDYHHPAATDFWQMLYYHMGWESLTHPPTVRGKRLRPLLTVLCTAAAGGLVRRPPICRERRTPPQLYAGAR